MSLSGTAASGGAKLLGAQAIRVAVQAVGIVVLSRLITPGDFGLFVMVAAIANVAVVIGDFGLSAAAIQSQSISQHQRSNLFWTNAGLGLALSLTVFLIAEPLASFYGHVEIAGIARAISITFLLNALAAQFRAEMSRSLKFGALAVIDSVAPVVALVASIAAALIGAGYWALVLQPVVLAFMSLVLAVWSANWFPGLPRRAPMRALYTFGLGTLGIQVMTYVSTNIDDVLVGRFWGPTQAGYYSRAFQLFRLPMQQIAVPIARVALPVLSRIQDDAVRFERYVLRGQLVLAYAFGGVFYLLAAVTGPVIDLALGAEWADAKPIFFVLAIGGVFQSITSGYWWMFQAKGLVGFALRFSLLGRSLMIALLFVGLPWGALGVAVASAVGQAVMWTLYTAFAVHRAGVSRRALVKQAITPVSCGIPATLIGFAATSLASPMAPVVQLLIGLFAFGSTILIEFLMIPPFRRDIRTVWSVALKALRPNRAA